MSVAAAPSGISARLDEADAAALEARIEWAREQDVARRIWRSDHTLWGPDPAEIADRLGWLRVVSRVAESLGELSGFAARAREQGLTDCVVLGMGGSSLAPEVMRRACGEAAGLRLHVLDSTHPDTVARLTHELPATTLHLVASKSGTTLEPDCFRRHFEALAGEPQRFAAITDPGTALDRLAGERGYRHVFRADPEIGGRYSALSEFGMVPATAAGYDTRRLLLGAEAAAQAATPELGAEPSVPLWLGLALGELARRGRDKLTFVCDPPLGGFGLWAEQLVAESTGKGGRGIVPVAGEPLGEPDAYGEDRAFAWIRNRDGDAAETAAALAALATAGHPVLELGFADPADLGELFFTWELAIAVAGAVLGINPFDQPDVQGAKDLTNEVIDAYVRDGGFPAERPLASDGPLSVYGGASEPGADGVVEALAALLGEAGPGRYLAVLAYVPESPEADAALTELRLAVRERRRCATTAGYGPRYLHSTGQLHKGGPPSGIFLQITCEAAARVSIPGREFDFGALVRAQAIGDLRALRARGLPALRVQLDGDPVAGLRGLAAAVAEAAGD